MGRGLTNNDRQVCMGPGLANIPERLLLAHARGEVLFVAGAGASKSSGLPDFRDLVLNVYRQEDTRMYDVLSDSDLNLSDLTPKQLAEKARFEKKEYDVVLGMLERRMGESKKDSSVRTSVVRALSGSKAKPAAIHRNLMRLADRGDAKAIVTTNFDLLLEDAARAMRKPVQTYSLGGIPRPMRNKAFAGVLHIHGALERNAAKTSDLILTDQDFGEFYLRRRIVTDFIYDAARLFHLVLVGYSANDPPMKYLLNAVAADGARFSDLKERYAFVGNDVFDSVLIEDWKERGITPIHYDSSNKHTALSDSLHQWAKFSAINGSKRLIDAEVKRIIKTTRSEASDSDCDLFDHFIRRSNCAEREHLVAVAAKNTASLEWLNAIHSVIAESSFQQ